MDLSIAAVGRLKDGPERDLYRRYEARISSIGKSSGFSSLSLLEIQKSKARSALKRTEEEGIAMLSKLPGDARIIALDERGKPQTSQQFAIFLQSQYRDSGGALAFVIGGPDGHGKTLRERAHHDLSLGPMTLPHGLARIILVEQIYRALTILSGHPYHRE